MCLACDDTAWAEVGRLEGEIIELEGWLEQQEGERYLRQREFNRKLKRCEELYLEVDKIKRQLNRECTSQCYDSCSIIHEQHDEALISLAMSVG